MRAAFNASCQANTNRTASGPERVQKVSTAQHHQCLLSLLLKEVQETLKGLRIWLVQPGRSTGEFLVIDRRLGHRGAGRVVETTEG